MELKFRFFREKPTPKMIYPTKDFYINHVGIPFGVVHYPESIELEQLKLLPLLYTGFKDINKKEIFLGDILQTRDESIGYVIWDDGSFAIKSPGSEAIDWEHGSFYRASEVIGNIYENKDLIE